jgi:hypothetical protein
LDRNTRHDRSGAVTSSRTGDSGEPSLGDGSPAAAPHSEQ